MNDIMANDPVCSQRGLKLRTYQVIPMTPRFDNLFCSVIYGALCETVQNLV